MINEKLCAFCGMVGPHNTIIECEGSPHVTFKPCGDTVLLGQMVDGAATVTIHEDTPINDIAALMSALMDRIAQFPQVRDNPLAIIGAIQKGMVG
jgi:hypothetical protein